MKIMANHRHSWKSTVQFSFLILVIISQNVTCRSHNSNETLTACQHIRRSESRRAKALGDEGTRVRIPKCSRLGDFEPIQCSNDIGNSDCWCVDEYGVEITGTRRDREEDVNCAAPSKCSASSCRMFCPAGFARDLSTGCPVCKCRDPCSGVTCPRGLSCEPVEVKCKTEPCPPIPTCRKARSFVDLCPAGQPLAISGTVRPFLCGLEPGKPQCPPLYRCLVQSGNDYGVCCPASLKYEKPGSCPSPDKMDVMESAGVLCGPGCTHDLECNQMQKCCQTSGCGKNCQQPFNVTVCHQARLLSEILSVNEREGRGYVPQCDGPGGTFSNKQCSRNGLVCWCVDPSNGNKVKGTMGAANTVTCEGIEILVSRGRSLEQSSQCDQNICAAVCEYGFKHDHNGCPTCECSEPCEGFLCPMGSHCEVATDPQCTSGSGLCASEPVCKPNQVYSNPCDIGTPLVDNVTAEVMFCQEEITTTTAPVYQGRSFLDDDIAEVQGRAMSNIITCPADYRCTKLHREAGNVCCPAPQETIILEDKPQTMCEYLRDFTERMEGTEDGMSLAITSPRCDEAGMYMPVQCQTKLRKVPRSEQKKYLEQQNVRQMRKLLESAQPKSRSRRNSESLKLYRIDNEGNHNVGVDQILSYLRQTVDSQQAEGRSAKVIDIEAIDAQTINEPEKPVHKRPAASKRPIKVPVDDMIEVEVEECWCVDGFGTEIPKSRGDNVTLATCKSLRQSLECLDLTCRMGCDYGFHLDTDTQCPSCECRDPCDNVQCPDNQECRTVEVSCDGEYCPPVPACLPRKPGQCPFLVPPGSDEGSDLNTCEYECRSDTHCDGNKRCCTNGCGTQCVEPQFKTACQHLQTIQLHQASELGVPPKQKYIAQCSADGSWATIQCGPGNECWCVDELGNEKAGTRIVGDQPDCDVKTVKAECPALKCKPCEDGYRVDAKGCRTCECKDLCKDISCPGGEECELVQVECISLPCPKMPICMPVRDSVCMEGLPLKSNGREISCGPQNDADTCPSTHSCQINPLSNRGVCCRKTRDVCFESMETNCMKSDEKTGENVQKWRFSPRLNKCVTIKVPKASSTLCQSKNLFHSDTACQSVCPVLSQCERLKLKNSMAAKRAGGQANAFFQPRCNSETGSWSPVQCLGNGNVTSDEAVGVCWCADKKGAPVKGSLTKGVEPKCNSRQARRKNEDQHDSENPVMEELIRQITYLTDDSNFIEDEFEVSLLSKSESTSESLAAVTERIITMARSSDVLSEQINRRSDPQTRPAKIEASTTRCNALKASASFTVACDTNGAFLPTQCNDNVCWCVDAAGNQLPASTTFERGARACQFTPVEAVEVEMLLQNPNKQNLDHLYDVLRRELAELLGQSPENFRVHENYDGNAVLKFDLTDDNKIDMAYAIEDAIRQNNLFLYNGFLQPDITRSGFMHRISVQLPVPQPASGIPESAFQTIIFIIATASAFLVSIFVVFVMLKRGKNRTKNVTYDSQKTGDKYLDYSSPIFVLSTNEKE